MKERKRKITVITVIGIMLILAITTFTYAIWSRTHTQTGTNKNTYACFEISYAETNGDGISIENGFPQKDEQGMQNDAYEVEIKNTCDTVSTYNVILNKQEDSNLDDSHLKVAVDNNYKLLSDATLTDKRTIEGFQNEKSYIIGTGVVGPKQTKIVQIRSWMDKDTTEIEGENKSFTFKITIEAVAGINEGEIKTQIFGKEYVAKTEVPDFEDGFPLETTSEEEITAKSGLYLAFDDDGPSYYFRGDVKNNYVKLSQDSDLVWRILRVNGDGSVRIILKDDNINLSNIHFNEYTDDEKYVGYTYDNNSPCTNDNPCKSDYIGGEFKNSENIGVEANIKTKLEEWYQTNLSKYDDKIALTTFCNDTSYADGDEIENYSPYSRLLISSVNPSLNCPDPINQDGENRDYGGVYKLKIGLITADELIMAGLANTIDKTTERNFMFSNSSTMTMSAAYFDHIHIATFIDSVEGFITTGDIDVDDTAHPVINLKADVTVTGSGTQSDPYVVQ